MFTPDPLQPTYRPPQRTAYAQSIQFLLVGFVNVNSPRDCLRRATNVNDLWEMARCHVQSSGAGAKGRRVMHVGVGAIECMDCVRLCQVGVGTLLLCGKAHGQITWMGDKMHGNARIWGRNDAVLKPAGISDTNNHSDYACTASQYKARAVPRDGMHSSSPTTA